MKEMRRNIELEHKRLRSARIICIIYCIFLFDTTFYVALFCFCLLVFLCLVNFVLYVVRLINSSKEGKAAYQFVLSFLCVNLFRGKRL